MSCLYRNLYSVVTADKLLVVSESGVVCAFVRRGKRSKSASSNFFIMHSSRIFDAKVCRSDGLNGLFGVGITDYCVDSLNSIPGCIIDADL